MTEKRPPVSFMIEDILGDTKSKRKPQLDIPSTTVSTRCSSAASKEDSVLCTLPAQSCESYSYALSSECSHLSPTSSHIFLPPSSSPLPTRFGYHSPAIAASPPYAFPSCNPAVFFPSDFNEHLNTTYLSLRHENIMRSAIYNPSVILDLSNYVPKSSSARIPSQGVVPISSSGLECSSGRQIIWKHFPRNPAKRKGGQIRFTTEQTTTLEGTFQEHKYLSSSERKRLAAALRLSERQVKTWFQNRRAKWRRIKQEPADHASSNDSDDSDRTEETCRVEHPHFPISNKTHPSTFA